MSDKFKNWTDFNKCSVEVQLDNEKYNSVIILEDDILELKIDISKDYKKWVRKQQDFDTIKGRLISNNINVTFVNCMTCGLESFITNDKFNCSMNFKIDRIVKGYHLDGINFKKFNKFKVQYNGIGKFFEKEIYKLEWNASKVLINTISNKHSFNGNNINIFLGAKMKEHNHSFTVDRQEIIEFEINEKIDFCEMIKIIYKFRNLLMILLKKDIIVQKQFIIDNDNVFEIYDCNRNKEMVNNEKLKEHLEHRCIKYENINNFDEILEKYDNLYERLYPLLELYFNVQNNQLPNLIRYLNAMNMVEYFSREFDNDNAVKLTMQKKPNKKSKEAEFVYRVESLIQNVNEVFSFTLDDIGDMSEKIKDGRTYFVHYVKDGKKLEYNELFHFYNFVEDVLLLNVYKLIGLDITKHEYITYLDFFYMKKDLL